MPSLFRNIILALTLTCFGCGAFAQLPDVGNLYLTGKIVNEKKRGMQSKILLYKDGIRIDSFRTNRIGRFEFFIPLQDSVALVVLADGYVSKTVFVDGRVPNDRKDDDYNFPFFIDLYPVGNIPSNIDLRRPVGKVIFSGTQFIYDIAFTEQQNQRLKEFVKERKQMKVRVHDQKEE